MTSQKSTVVHSISNMPQPSQLTQRLQLSILSKTKKCWGHHLAMIESYHFTILSNVSPSIRTRRNLSGIAVWIMWNQKISTWLFMVLSMVKMRRTRTNSTKRYLSRMICRSERRISIKKNGLILKIQWTQLRLIARRIMICALISLLDLYRSFSMICTMSRSRCHQWLENP